MSGRVIPFPIYTLVSRARTLEYDEDNSDDDDDDDGDPFQCIKDVNQA